MAVTLALIVCTLLSLSFASTRAIGILGTGVLILLFPRITTATIVLGCGVAYLIYRHKKGIKP